LIVLAGCSGNAPEQSTEVAVKGIYSAALSPGADYAIIGSITHGGSLWRLSDMERLYNWNHQSNEQSSSTLTDNPLDLTAGQTNIIACAFSPDGKFAFTADHLTMVLWDVTTGESITYWTAPAEVLSVALSPNGSDALLGLDNHQAVLYDAKRGGIKRRFNHQNRVRSVDMSDDGKWAVTGSEDQTAVLWNVATGKAIHQWTHTDEVRLVAMANDASRILSVSKYDKAMLWQGSDGKAIGEIPLGGYAIKRGLTLTAAAFSADGNLLATGNADRRVELWDSNTLTKIKDWELPKRDAWKPTAAAVVSLEFGPQNTLFAAASNGFIHQLKY
jgi:WD40 repeat protein